MQALAAYLIFILAYIGLGLSIIVARVLSIALYEGASWMSRLYLRMLGNTEAAEEYRWRGRSPLSF
jgi:hypothetical protein